MRGRFAASVFRGKRLDGARDYGLPSQDGSCRRPAARDGRRTARRASVVLLLLAVVAATSGCDSRPRAGPLTFERMRDQPRYEAYGQSTHFDDGMAMRPPPPGTVAQESGANDAVSSGRERGTLLTSIPVTIDRAAIARGQQRYEVFCRPCHDIDGAGDTPVAHNMRLRPPPSLLEARIRGLSVGRIFEVISEGYGLMPRYARQLTPAERWDVVAYLRALQLRDRLVLHDLPPAMRADARRALGPGGARD